jgi:hypothetical protein
MGLDAVILDQLHPQAVLQLLPVGWFERLHSLTLRSRV